MTPADLSRLHALIALQEPSRDSDARALTEAERKVFLKLANARIAQLDRQSARNGPCTFTRDEISEYSKLTLLT